MKNRKHRIAMYSPGMVGFGHIRRNASIAQALRSSALDPVIVMLAEARQAAALPMPDGVDVVTLPALCKEGNGCVKPRFLDVSNRDLIALRAEIIATAIKAFEPDVLIVDHLPRGAGRELGPTLERLRTRGHTRCVLGLRDVLQDPVTVQNTWFEQGNVDAIRDYYDAIWVYSDPAVYDPVREYALLDAVAAKVQYTGYIDQRPRLEFCTSDTAQVLANLPEGRMVVCVVGGGQDGARLAEAFLGADLLSNTTGVIVTGLYMPRELRQRLHRLAETRRCLKVLEFLPEPAPLIHQAERVIAMGGYNTLCEMLSFEKHALIVPRVEPKPEQWIRARRMRDLGLIEMLHPAQLSSRALTEWLARDLGPPPALRSRIDLGGLVRIPSMLAELLDVSLSPVSQLAKAS